MGRILFFIALMHEVDTFSQSPAMGWILCFRQVMIGDLNQGIWKYLADPGYTFKLVGISDGGAGLFNAQDATHLRVKFYTPRLVRSSCSAIQSE